MTLKIKTLMVGAGMVALTACGEATPSWHQEAGAFVDEGGFGNPTMTNMMAQMCAGQAKGYIVPDPVVVLDPKSGGQSYQRGWVRCSGHLNGKYARIIWNRYVDSATPPSGLDGGGLAAINAAQGGGG